MNYELFKKEYWKFLLKSTNQHGVHSPFVYDLVTLCFYKKQGDSKNDDTIFNSILKKFPKPFFIKHIRVLNTLLHYFSAETIVTFSPKTHGIRELSQHNNLKSSETKTADLIYVATEYCSTEAIENIFNQLHNNSTLIIEQPYRNPLFWNAIKSHPKTRVVVDTYYFGFIFIRKEQAKEEFYIRL